jgi:hypothetical protein
LGVLFGVWRQGIAEEEGVPRCLVYLPPHRTIHAIVIEKSSATLSIYLNDEEGLRLVERFPCSLGRVEGDKLDDGDQRTPSGIFWLEAYIPQDELPPEYGAGALVLNYPNFFHLIEGRKGGGIWIHGTHLPERTEYSRDTDGCIVVTNQNFQEIFDLVDLLASPVIIQDRVLYLDADQWRQEQTIFLQNLQRWLRTWEGDKFKELDALYSRNFMTDPQGAGHFLRVRRTLTQDLKRNQVWVRNLLILRNGTTALFTFTQEWWTDQGISRWVKVLYWNLEGHDWKIIGEEVLERPVASAAG